MNIIQSKKIIVDRAEIYGMSILDMLIVMQDQLQRDELTKREARALRVFLTLGREFFAPI
jgi:hypothetical protein